MRRTSNYLERIVLSDLAHMVSIDDPMVVVARIPKIDSRLLEKEFTKLIHMNPLMTLYLRFN